MNFDRSFSRQDRPLSTQGRPLWSISDFILSDKIELLSEAHGVIDQLRRSANENKVQSQRSTVHTEPHRKVTELREVREESTELTFTDNGDRDRD